MPTRPLKARTRSGRRLVAAHYDAFVDQVRVSRLFGRFVAPALTTTRAEDPMLSGNRAESKPALPRLGAAGD